MRTPAVYNGYNATATAAVIPLRDRQVPSRRQAGFLSPSVDPLIDFIVRRSRSIFQCCHTCCHYFFLLRGAVSQQNWTCHYYCVPVRQRSPNFIPPVEKIVGHESRGVTHFQLFDRFSTCAFDEAKPSHSYGCTHTLGCGCNFPPYVNYRFRIRFRAIMPGCL